MSSNSNAEMLAGVTAALLGLGRRIDLWSLALLLVAIIVLAISAGVLVPWRSGCLLVSVLAGIAQKYFSLRVALDAALFKRLANHEFRKSSVQDGETLMALDSAMADCGLIKAQGGLPRDLTDRCRGAMRLLYSQAICMALQLGALFAVVVGGLF
ncbi:MAG: hypothetical protein IPG33_05570 [Betaproteobacteria bacterium]|nr:hypothetical protein [Betaproteobacteria bacterium]